MDILSTLRGLSTDFSRVAAPLRRRRVLPESIEMLEYGGKRFEGLVAYCYEREDLRHFRIDRMLEVEVL